MTSLGGRGAARVPPVSGSLLESYRRSRFTWLFVVLLLTLGAGPTLNVIVPAYEPLATFLALTLLGSIASVVHEGQWALPLGLAVAFAVATGLRWTLGLPGMMAVSEAAWLGAVVLAGIASLRHTLRPGVVDRERIFAALDGYLITGLLFGAAYWALARSAPASFATATGPLGALDLDAAIYFSFVTIATMGYGDIAPATAPARGLAVMEGVIGQMYLVVLVARLVGLYTDRRSSEND